MSPEERGRISGVVSRLFGIADGAVACRVCRQVKFAGVFGIDDHEPWCPVRDLMEMARKEEK